MTRQKSEGRVVPDGRRKSVGTAERERLERELQLAPI